MTNREVLINSLKDKEADICTVDYIACVDSPDCKYDGGSDHSVCDEQNCRECRMCQKEDKPKKTNADWIRGMNNAELVEFLLKVNTAYAEPCMTGEKDCKWEDYPTHDKGCKDCFKEWLEKEREDICQEMH